MQAAPSLVPENPPVRIDAGERGAAVIAEFDARRRSGRYDRLPAHHQPFEEPYVVRHHVAGIEFDVLIANENAMHWYEDPDRVIATAVYCGELDIVREYGLASPGDVVLDCGAHHGVLAGMVAKIVGPSGHVFAFEPSLIGSDLIELNARLNGLENVTAVRAAVGDVRGSGRFSERDARFGIEQFDATEVPRVVLDDYADKRPNLIKIDVEGAEGRVLAGARRVLEQMPNIMLELHPRWMVESEGTTQDAIIGQVDWARYDCHQAIGAPPYIHVDYPDLPEEGGWIAARLRDDAAVPAVGRAAAEPPPSAGRRRRAFPLSWRRHASGAVSAGGIQYDVRPLRDDDPLGRAVRDAEVPGGPVHDAVLRAVRRGTRVLDLGARIGTTSLHAARDGARVLAVEADAAYAESLRGSAGLNRSDVVVVHAMPADTNGTLQFSPAGPWGHVRKVTEIDDITTPIEVEALRPDDVLAQAGWDRVDLVKMTLSGYEPAALEGLRDTLTGPVAPELLVLESNAHALTWYDRTPADLRRQLAELGYRSFLFDWRRPNRVVPVEPDDIQPECVTTLLAARDAATLERLGYSVEPFTETELLERLLAASASDGATDRWHAARELERGPAWLRAEPRVRAAMEPLQRDPAGLVREAVWWANEAQAGADAGAPDSDGGGESPTTTMEVPGAGRVTLVVPRGPADPVVRELVERDEYPPFGPNDIFLQLLRPGMRFLDVGCHVGTFTLPAAALGAQVLAVDAHPQHAGLVRQAAELNGFADRVSVVHAAIGSEPGELSLMCSFGWSRIDPPDGGPDVHGIANHIAVPARPLRDILAEAGWDRVDLIKMDIEGSEMRAVEGIGDLLEGADAPDVLVEVNPLGLAALGSSPGELLGVFERSGYRLFKLEEGEEERLLVPIRADAFLPDPADDVLALKRAPAFEGWRVREPLSRHDQVDRVVQTARSPFSASRAALATRLEEAPSWLLRDPLVREALRALRHDLHPAVRDAAAWSSDLA